MVIQTTTRRKNIDHNYRRRLKKGGRSEVSFQKLTVLYVRGALGPLSRELTSTQAGTASSSMADGQTEDPPLRSAETEKETETDE